MQVEWRISMTVGRPGHIDIISATSPKEGTCSVVDVALLNSNTVLPLPTSATLAYTHWTNLSGVQGRISKPKAPIAHPPFILPTSERGMNVVCAIGVFYCRDVTLYSFLC